MRSSACCCPGRLPSKRPTESSTTFCARPTSPSRVCSNFCSNRPASQRIVVRRRRHKRGNFQFVVRRGASQVRAPCDGAQTGTTREAHSRIESRRDQPPDVSSIEASGSAGRRCPACGRSGSRNSLTEPSRYAGSCGNTRNQIAAALLASEAELLVSPPRGARIWPALTTGRAYYR